MVGAAVAPPSINTSINCKTKLITTKVSKSTLSFKKFFENEGNAIDMLQFNDFFFSGGGTLRDRLDDLNSKLGQVNTLVTESDTQIENAKMKSEKATQKVVNAKEIIDQARESLRVIFFFSIVCWVMEFLIYPVFFQLRCATAHFLFFTILDP